MYGLDDSYIPKAATCLVAVNVLAWAALSLMGNTESAGFLMDHGAMSVEAVRQGDWFTLITAMFVHFGLPHLLNNMIILFFLGRYVEQETGPVLFLIVYLLSGLAGNICTYYFYLWSGTDAVSAGASGAIFGLMGWVFGCFIRRKGKLGTMNPRGILIMVFLSVYQGFVSVSTNNLAHISGLLCGLLCALLAAGYKM